MIRLPGCQGTYLKPNKKSVLKSARSPRMNVEMLVHLCDVLTIRSY